MQRRALLAALATTGGALGTAGCLQSMGASTDPGTDSSDGTSPGSGTRDDANRDTTDPEPTDDGTRTDDGDAPPSDDAREPGPNDPEWNPTGDPVETYRVGDRSTVVFPDSNRPHGITLWNRVDRERTIRVAYTDGATEEAEVLGSVAVPGGHAIEIALQVPTRYALSVFVDDESFGTVAVGREWFDCNTSGGSYALGKTDLVDYGTTTTLVACADPRVASRSFAVTERDCGTESDERATIVYDGERVRFKGTFVSGTQCAQLSLAPSTNAGDASSARFVVDADPQDDGGCVQCVGAIDYEGTVHYERDLPDHVELAHRTRDGETHTVAKADRNANV